MVLSEDTTILYWLRSLRPLRIHTGMCCTRDCIRVLSIGTPSNALPLQGGQKSASPPLVAKAQHSTPVNDIRLLATAIVDDPPDAASFSAHVMLGGKVSDDDGHPISDGPVVRLNPILQPVLEGGEWRLPTKDTRAGKAKIDINAFRKLIKMDMAATTDEAVQLIDLLYEAWKDGNILNQPIHTAVDLMLLVGQRYFGDGIALWERWGGRRQSASTIDSDASGG